MGRMFGKYVLLHEIAKGGMARIQIAKQSAAEGFEKLLVIKTLLPDMAAEPDLVQLFISEAKLAAQLSHPNIVEIFDLGRMEDTYFIAMEYIHGEDLASILQTCANHKTRVPLGLALKIVSQSCEALHHAHTKTDLSGHPLGLVHRDVSPQNIVVSFDGVVKLVDFGIARLITRGGGSGSRQMGKLAYMAPEQYLEQPIDARTDIFALGVVMWELLTNRRLFGRYRDDDLATVIVHADAPSPIEFNPDLSLDLDAIVLQALARNPAERFQSAHEMYDAIEACMRSERLDSDTFEIGKWMQGMFQHKLEAVRRIEQAQAAGTGLESFLFDDLFGDESGMWTSAQAGIDPSRPLEQPFGDIDVPDLPQFQYFKPAPRKRRGTTFLVLVLVLVVGGLGFVFRDRIASLFATDSVEAVPESRLAAAPPTPTVLVVAEPGPAPPMDESSSGDSKTPAVPPPGKALLSLRSLPEVVVYADQQPIGRTPLRNHVIEPGQHVYLLSNEKLGTSEILDVYARAGEHVERTVRFGEGLLRIDAPPGGEVWANQEKLGGTPLTRRLFAGTYEIQVRYPGSDVRHAQTVRIERGKTSLVRVEAR